MLNSFDVACLICTPKFRTHVVRRYCPECIVHRCHDHAVASWEQVHPGHINKFCTAAHFAAKANALKRFKTQFPIEQFDHGSSTSGKGNTVLLYYNMLPVLNFVCAGLQSDNLLHSEEMKKLEGAARVAHEDFLDPTGYHEQTTEKQTTDKAAKQSGVYFQCSSAN